MPEPIETQLANEAARLSPSEETPEEALQDFKARIKAAEADLAAPAKRLPKGSSET